MFPDLQQPVTTTKHWSDIGDIINLVRIFRLVEVVYYVVLCAAVFYAIDFSSFSELPMVTVYNATSGMSAMNPQYGYPIKLNGFKCSPFDLDISICGDEMLTSSPSQCCEELFDKNSWPDETLSSLDNYLLLTFTTLALMIIRLLLWRFVYDSKQYSSIASTADKRFWILAFWDNIVALLAASVFAALLTNYAKQLIGSPRPCYYALQIYSSLYSSRAELEDTSNTSFVSGHAASSATVLGYELVAFLADIQYFRDHQPSVVFAVTQLMLVPITLVAWIGYCRIKDCWHFEADVVGGWLIGFGSACFAYVCVAKYSRADALYKAIVVPSRLIYQNSVSEESLSIVLSDIQSDNALNGRVEKKK